jgi:hypothetical protein
MKEEDIPDTRRSTAKMTEDELVLERKRTELILSGYRRSQTIAMLLALVGAGVALVTGYALWFPFFAAVGVFVIFIYVSSYSEFNEMRYLKYLRREERSLHAILVGKADRVSTQPTSPTARKGPNVSGMA